MAENIRPHPPVELPVMSSGWKASPSRPHRRTAGAMPQESCSPVLRNTQHADAVGQAGCTGYQCTHSLPMRGCTGYQCTPLTAPSHRSSHTVAYSKPMLSPDPCEPHHLLLTKDAARSAATPRLAHSATEAPEACCSLLCTPSAQQKSKNLKQLHRPPAWLSPATPH